MNTKNQTKPTNNVSVKTWNAYKTPKTLPMDARDLVVKKHASNERMTRYSTALTLAGKRIELKKYTRPISRYHHKQTNNANVDPNPNPKPYERRNDAIKRAKRNLQNLIYTNVTTENQRGQHPRFIRLSYRDEDLPKTPQEQAQQMQNFLKRLHRKYGEQKIIYISEYSPEKKRLHWHLIAFNMPWNTNEQLAEIWTHGFVKAKKIQLGYGGAQRLARYLSKYMASDMEKKYKYQKSYGTTKNLEKPLETIDADHIQEILIQAYQNGYRQTYKSKPYELTFHAETYVTYKILEPPDTT